MHAQALYVLFSHLQLKTAIESLTLTFKYIHLHYKPNLVNIQHEKVLYVNVDDHHSSLPNN